MAINWDRKKCTKEEFIKAVHDPEVKTYVDLAVVLGYTAKKNVHRANFDLMAKDLNIDLNEYLTIGHDKNSYSSRILNVYTDEEIFVANSPARRSVVKNRIVKNNLLEYECSSCGISSWHGYTITLHLDHINGIGNDNRLDNLRFLCYNCHTQTKTYGNKKCNSDNNKLRTCSNDGCSNTLNPTNKNGICYSCLYTSNTDKIIVDDTVWLKLNMTEKEFVKEWNSSITISEAVSKIHAYGNKKKREYIKIVAFSLGLNRDHMNQYSVTSSKRTKEQVLKLLTENSLIDTKIKNLMLEYEILENKCSHCGISNFYNDKPLTLQLDHIDGDRTNNRLANLRILCPNCHALTDSYSNNTKSGTGKIIEKHRKKKKPAKSVKRNDCINMFCNNKTWEKNSLCLDCYNKSRTVNFPTKDELIRQLKDTNVNFTRTGKHFNVTDSAVKKWCIKYDMPYKRKELKDFLDL